MYRIKHIFTGKVISMLDGSNNPIYAECDEAEAYFNFVSDANVIMSQMSFVNRALHRIVLISEDF